MAPRKRGATKSYAEDSDAYELADDDEADEAFDQPKPAKKRAKKAAPVKATKGKGARSAGKLSLFTSFPVDVIIVICSFVGVTDLLALSWTSKALRKLVMDKKIMGKQWERAGLRITRIPKPPPDQSWPKWIRLLFIKTCYECGEKCTRMDAHIRLRLCPKCIPGKIGHFRSEGVLVSNLVPTGTWMRGHSFPWNDFLPAKTRYKVPYVYLPALHTAEARLRKLDLNPYAHVDNSTTKGHPAFGGHAGIYHESKQGAQTRARRPIFHNEMLRWVAQQAANNADAADDATSLRIKQIRERLIQAGHEPEDLPSDLWYLSACQQPRPLTDAIWKKISPLLEQEIAEHKLREERRRQRLAASAATPVAPAVVAHTGADLTSAVDSSAPRFDAVAAAEIA